MADMARIIKMVRGGAKPTQISKELKVTYWEARKLYQQALVSLGDMPKVTVNIASPIFKSAILRLLKRPITLHRLAEILEIDEKTVESSLEDLEACGYIINYIGGTIQLGTSIDNSKIPKIVLNNHFDGKPVTFGFVTDTHLCSRSERLDVLEVAYDTFAKRGITHVFHAGNMVDGECRFNAHELLAHGITDQAMYVLDHYPQRKGMKTYFIDGDDHEGWWMQREGIQFGRYLEMEARDRGRNDLVYMGYLESDFILKSKRGQAAVKVMHPGGGSAYAFSYSPQKITESLQGGEKPAVLLIGHFHKMEYCYPRSVHVVQGGTTQDQTRFMRKKKLEAHVGFVIITLEQDICGGVTRFLPEFFPFFDRGYIIKRDVEGIKK